MTETQDKRTNPIFHEYAIEDGSGVDLAPLEAQDLLPKDIYQKAHEGLVIPCHDVFIRYEGKILLVVREGAPVKGILWPIGGRIKRGVSTINSLRVKVKEECGLDLEDIRYLGAARTFFKTDPFSHGKGTDTINQVYSAKGIGDLKLNELHSKPTLLGHSEYLAIKHTLHPYVRDFMDLAFSQHKE